MTDQSNPPRRMKTETKAVLRAMLIEAQAENARILRVNTRLVEINTELVARARRPYTADLSEQINWQTEPNLSWWRRLMNWRKV